MLKHKAKLKLLSAGDGEEITIFVHGYNSSSQKLYDNLIYCILSANLSGRVYLYAWKSGNFNVPASSTIAKVLYYLVKSRKVNPYHLLADVVIHAAHFKWFESRARKYGEEFSRHIEPLRTRFGYRINLIGHSLGALLIYSMLTAPRNWRGFNISDVIMMGGAVDASAGDWDKVLESISGRLYNVWSRKDRTLLATPDFSGKIGRNSIPYKSRRITNRAYPSFQHNDYWPNLEYIFTRLWRNYRPVQNR